MISPNELTHQITLQIKSIAQDSELSVIVFWNDWHVVWSSPLPKTGREFYRLNTNNSEVTEAFKIRYIRGVNPHQRIKFRSKLLEIIEVINTGELNEELILTAKGAI